MENCSFLPVAAALPQGGPRASLPEGGRPLLLPSVIVGSRQLCFLGVFTPAACLRLLLCAAPFAAAEMQQQEEKEGEGGEGLTFSEAMDIALGANRKRVLRVVNVSTFCLFLLSLSLLHITREDQLLFNLLLGFLALTVAFAAALNWTMALVEEEEEPQEADERGAVEDKKEQ
ncbi:hypothetical protein Efla_002219 [Eimeria flavescens]